MISIDDMLDRASAPLLLLGRLLLVWIFLHESMWLTSNFEAARAAMTKMGVPPFALVGTIALQFVAGLAVAIGIGCRVAALALAGFCVATAILFHGHTEIRGEMLHFEKDLAIAGGMLALAAVGPGALAWRLPRRGEEAEKQGR